MTKEELRLHAYRWVRDGSSAPLANFPESWRLPFADLTAEIMAEFTLMIEGELMRRESHWEKLAKDAINCTPNPRMMIERSAPDSGSEGKTCGEERE